ncbi:hypothetical protein J4O15_08555 [Lachnoanaerobaculum sp. Marseille-Q4761]|uniref:hypothetical protein n=1 Tax=Lachnoanaerobaculum sp. Marseille-Q4761 TaxID=2819511 RepID=UPI001AA1AC87|nr:hypothetical protein [Lachnoanaerobaculum sp. Marseille-Q4761]MBO1870983.1 hypothetical protein [Lachnoanaerobaculum sp. Marseille-Q4761]
MEIKDLINQDIENKKLLLFYFLEKMREGLYEIRLNDTEKFRDETKKFTGDYGLKNRILTAKENIIYLINEKKIYGDSKNELESKIEDLSSKIIELVEEIKIEFEEFRKNSECDKPTIECFIKKIKNKYIELISRYEDFLIEEAKIKEEVIKIWIKELTDCEKYAVNDKFKFLVYTARLNADKVVKNVLYDNGVIHTSYITDTHTNVYCDREYGLVFYINKETLLYMCKGDAQTADFERVIDNGFSMNDFHCFSTKGMLSVHNSSVDLCSTYIPEQLLGEKYNEVVLINNKYNMPKAVFVFDDAKEHWRIEANKLKEILGLRLIEIKRYKGKNT